VFYRINDSGRYVREKTCLNNVECEYNENDKQKSEHFLFEIFEDELKYDVHLGV
jgi:hypothetical protein